MTFFSGFGFKDEIELFEEFKVKSDFTLSGFSYGSIKAVEYALKNSDRIDLLQLFSPAYFTNLDFKIKNLQLKSYSKDPIKYMTKFYQNVLFPTQKRDIQRHKRQTSLEDLEKLLFYEWSSEKMQTLKDRGINIEVYLGTRDKIVDNQKSKKFFLEFATLFEIKNCGHLLQV